MRTNNVKKVLFSALLTVLTQASLGGCIIAHHDDDEFEHHRLHHFYFGHD